MVELNKIAKAKDRIPKDYEGIVFTTYATLRQDKKPNKEYTAPGESEFYRVNQLVDWLGTDNDGLFAWDEAHNMGSAGKATSSDKNANIALQARAGLEIQELLSNMRHLYASATAAVQVSAFMYAPHLGIWGAGKPFTDGQDFVSKMHDRGTGALEMVANNLKAGGLYMARNLALENPTDPDLTVTYEAMTAEATGEQRGMYETIAEAWQLVVREMADAGEQTGAPGRTGLSQMWGAQQRFFSHLLISMSMPTILERATKELDAGRAVVMSLTDTNEALANRKRAEQTEGEAEEDLDLSPRDILTKAVRDNFPTTMYEPQEKGPPTPVPNPEFNPDKPQTDDNHPYMQDPAMIAKRDELLMELSLIPMPEGPLEQLFSHTREDGSVVFTPDNTAEITGRKSRSFLNPETGVREKQEGRGTKKVVEADLKDFMGDEKQVLVYSKMGGTGMSYHASLAAKNQRKRVHFIVQPGWQADIMKQMLGRTHRANERYAPHSGTDDHGPAGATALSQHDCPPSGFDGSADGRPA